MEAYCFKYQTKQEIRNPQQVTMKNGEPATKSVCPVGGTKVFRIEKCRPLASIIGSIAFPAISTDTFGNPVEEVAEVLSAIVLRTFERKF